MSEISYSQHVIKDLIEGKLPWTRTKSIISGHKDEDRFDKYIQILQDKVPWPERILLPLTDQLFIVQKGDNRITKCGCGHEFGDYRENWKLKALIHVRESEEELKELYPYTGTPEPDYCEVREFYCPGCGAQLQVETVPFGYPIVFDFLPDLDSFYRDWLGTPLPQEMEFKDLSPELIGKDWATE